MDRELQLLSQISNNEHVTQRQLAKELGLSLGSINGILQDMINKGYINVHQINSRALKYIITPLGKKAKDLKTYDEVVVSYKMISKVRQMTKKIIEEQIEKGYYHFYLYGQHDEVYKIVKMSIIEAKRLHNVKYHEIELLSEVDSTDSIVITWNNDDGVTTDNNLVLNVLSNVV
ncbi:winged helix-turn-helix transcriptional regulator [Vallitalea sp.]|jgi:predicted transcriptional regulator|uniref:winged helix-turn-helix transcriptional regulator n=1 Tax=Vallitalea sp. TaxID=1882829 RepID=UPI0025FD3FD7|nr:winged helix-turn-helix transcriptional regulator [Vallitalea sp.]MCT4688384.1 winged helix-turn-helix transcriptional regulator [Vallitalea sp.]